MRYLFLNNTPAQVHLYRNAVTELAETGHEVLVLARDHGCTLDLLDYYELPYEVYGKREETKSSVFVELPDHLRSILTMAHRFDPEAVFGLGAYAAFAGTVTRTPVVVVLDAEVATLNHTVCRPFIDTILTPHAFRKDLGPKHYRFRGFKECAYLHPNNYSPTTDIRTELGVSKNEQFLIVRFNSFTGHHDIDVEGFSRSQRLELLRTLSKYASVFVSDESEQLDLHDEPATRFNVHPAYMHDALSEASLLIADTQTMVNEAALLGTPAIRSNSFVGDDDMGNFIELARVGLVHNLTEFSEVMELATDLLADESRRRKVEIQAREYMQDKLDLAELIVTVAEDFEHRNDILAKKEGVGVHGHSF